MMVLTVQRSRGCEFAEPGRQLLARGGVRQVAVDVEEEGGARLLHEAALLKHAEVPAVQLAAVHQHARAPRGEVAGEGALSQLQDVGLKGRRGSEGGGEERQDIGAGYTHRNLQSEKRSWEGILSAQLTEASRRAMPGDTPVSDDKCTHVGSWGVSTAATQVCSSPRPL